MYLHRMNRGFQNLMFFFYFCLPPKRRKAQEKSILKLQNAAISLIFEITLFHAIAIFILIKMHFGLLVSTNQMDWNHAIRTRF